MTPFARYFDSVAVINLPSRPDRLRSVMRELQSLGFDEEVISVPEAPRPVSADGFTSPGVHGNYLSHLNILREARDSDVGRLLVLEDDAIFSNAARNIKNQELIVSQANCYDWSMWFLGHKLRQGLYKKPRGLIPTKDEFVWAHAYSVNGESLIELIHFLEKLLNSRGDDLGKMYIDGAYYHYRAESCSKICLLSNPALSIQKGSDSNLAGPSNPGRFSLRKFPREVARRARDKFWRWSGLDFR